MVARKKNKKLLTGKIKEKNIQPLLMENIESLSRRTLDREIPFIVKTTLVDVCKEIFTKNNFNTFLKNYNLFLKEYDNDTLIFNISLINKNDYISSLRKRFFKKRNTVVCLNNENTLDKFIYFEYYIKIVKNIPNDMIWVNELTSRKLKCFRERCFGEIIFDSSIDRIEHVLRKIDGDILMKNIDCYVLHIPGLLYNYFKKDECQKANYIKMNLPYNLFNEHKI